MGSSTVHPDVNHEDQAGDDALYWRVVEATIREIFQSDGGVIADLREAVLSQPWMERQVFYNTEPFDLAADFLDIRPSREQRSRYQALSERLIAEEEASSSAATSMESSARSKDAASVGAGGHEVVYQQGRDLGSPWEIENVGSAQLPAHPGKFSNRIVGPSLAERIYSTGGAKFPAQIISGNLASGEFTIIYHENYKRYEFGERAQELQRFFGRKAGSPSTIGKGSKVDER